MAQYKGRIEKTFPSRFGGGSFALAGQFGMYYNTKQPLPAFAVPGATVEFDGTPGRNGKSVFVTDTSLKEVAGATPAAVAAGGGGNTFEDRQNHIVYQSSRKDALTMVQILLAAGALPLGKVESKKAGIIEDAVDRFTAVFFEDVETLGALERNPPGAGTPVAEKAETPAAELPE